MKARMIRVFPDYGYGFARVEDNTTGYNGSDIFIHFTEFVNVSNGNEIQVDNIVDIENIDKTKKGLATGKK